MGSDISGIDLVQQVGGCQGKAGEGSARGSFSTLAGGEELGAVAEDRGGGREPESLRWNCRQ